MTVSNEGQPVRAEELNATHLKQWIKVSPGLNDEPSVSGQLVEVHHTVEHLVRIVVCLDDANHLTLFLRSGVPIAFWDEPSQ